MFRIESKVDLKSRAFKENRDHTLRLVAEYKERLEKVQKGGPPAAHKKHKERGKLTARERLDRLFDPDTPFLEFSPLAAYGMYDDGFPSAGMIAGVGVIRGREVLVVANDATVKGGTYAPMTIKKHVRAQEVALENRLPWKLSRVFRLLLTLRPWGMMEVFMLGILVSVVKLGKMATIVPGVALWSFALLIIVLAAATAALDRRMVWDRLE